MMVMKNHRFSLSSEKEQQSHQQVFFLLEDVDRASDQQLSHNNLTTTISQQQQSHQLVFLLLEDEGRAVSLRARDLLLQLDIFLDRGSVNFPILRITRLVWKQDDRAYIHKWIGC